jgi:hypothetical protein
MAHFFAICVQVLLYLQWHNVEATALPPPGPSRESTPNVRPRQTRLAVTVVSSTPCPSGLGSLALNSRSLPADPTSTASLTPSPSSPSAPPCPAGSYRSAPWASCAQCAVGSYSLLGADACTLCPGGTFGDTPGLTNASCSGACSAGHECPAGSTTRYAEVCPAGFYAGAAAEKCSLCGPGVYGESFGHVSPACTAPCPAGLFGAVGARLTNASCSGSCSPGYACPAGSTNATAALCPRGAYSEAGAPVCSPCPLGRYGGAPGLTSASCTGPCRAGRYGALLGMETSDCTGACNPGFFCPVGSETPSVGQCGVGTYSGWGSGSCSECPAGRFGAETMMETANCSGPCPAGVFGETSGLTSRTCSGNCSAGYACPAGSTNATAVLCPPGAYSQPGSGSCALCVAGTYGLSWGEALPGCSGNCSAGYSCPPGSTNATALLCTFGTYSLAGVCIPCPRGTFGAAEGLSTPACSGPCAAGYFCPEGSTNATAVRCLPGTYSTPATGFVCFPCPAGRFGSTPGLAASSCSGECRVSARCSGSILNLKELLLEYWDDNGIPGIPCVRPATLIKPRIQRL